MKRNARIAVGDVELENRSPQGHRPEFFRVPSKGPDPWFGLTRSWYYSAEKQGLLRLVRLRQRGKLRGVTLVPFDEVALVILKAQQQSSP